MEEPGLYHEVLNEPEQERIMTTTQHRMGQRPGRTNRTVEGAR